MFRIAVKWDGLDTLVAKLIDMEVKSLSLTLIADEIARIMWDDNAIMRSQGIDINGVAFRELADSTWRKRKGVGPPLAPFGLNSPIIYDYYVEVIEVSATQANVIGNWPNTPWVHFHSDTGEPRNHLPIRDPVGISPDGQELISDAFDRWCEGLLID